MRYITLILTALAGLTIATFGSTIRKGAIMATSEANLKAAMEVAHSGDTEALTEMMNEGTVLITDEGIVVFLVEVHASENAIEFRCKGSSRIYWTTIMHPVSIDT